VYFPASAALALTPIDDFFFGIDCPFALPPVSPKSEKARPKNQLKINTN